jgi:hypothetical protein
MAKHPPVNTARWSNVFSGDHVQVWQDANDDIFFKVVIKGKRPKYFYNETAWSDVPRYIVDETGHMHYWSLFQ